MKLEALLSKTVRLNDRYCTALIDSGCTCCIISEALCRHWVRRRSAVETLGGISFTCIGVSGCTIEVDDCVASLEMMVVPGKPMNFDLIFGINAIRALGGVCIFGGGIMFGNRGCLRRQCAAGQQLKEEKPGYSIEFDSVSNRWTCKYNWIEGVEPVTIPNRISQYNVPDDAKQDFDREIELWIENEWLVPYNEQRYGPARCLLPLMAVREAVMLYNISPNGSGGEDATPMSKIYRYKVRLRDEVVPKKSTSNNDCPYSVGDLVWVRRGGERCDNVSRRGVVTGAVSDVVVNVDGLNRHVRDLRPRERTANGQPSPGSSTIVGYRAEGPPIEVTDSTAAQQGTTEQASPERTVRPSRQIRLPTRFNDFVMDDDEVPAEPDSDSENQEEM